MARQHGITSTTYDNMVIDSGAAYFGFTSLASPGTLMGATRGGSTFSVEQEVKDMAVDGAHGMVKGGRRIINIGAKLTINFIEHSLANFKRALAASTSAAFNTNWDKITRSVQIADTDFLTNVAIIGEVQGQTGAIGLIINNALADGNLELAFADKEEGVLPISYSGHFTTADLDTEPWEIIYPNT